MNTSKVTMEQLQIATDSYGTVIAYGDFVLASAYRYLGKGRIGNDARVYKLAEQPIPGWDRTPAVSLNANSPWLLRLRNCSKTPATPSPGRLPTPTNQHRKEPEGRDAHSRHLHADPIHGHRLTLRQA